MHYHCRQLNEETSKNEFEQSDTNHDDFVTFGEFVKHEHSKTLNEVDGILNGNDPEKNHFKEVCILAVKDKPPSQ